MEIIDINLYFNRTFKTIENTIHRTVDFKKSRNKLKKRVKMTEF